MNGKLHTLGLVLILSALIVSGCATPTPEPVGPSTGEGEYCVDKASGTKMSYEEAVEIAEGSECVAQGGLKETRFCNEDTGTWWIDLDIEKAGCMPACVVKVSDKTAEINWRCTGAVPPEDTIGQLVVAWYGYVVGLPAGSQFDDYLVLIPEGVGEIGVEGADEAVEAQIVALRDRPEPGKYANFWGNLSCDVLDYGGCQLLVTRLRVDGPGPFFLPDPVEGWEGTLVSGPPGPRSGGDDYLVLAGDFPIQYGVDSLDPALHSQLESLRDTGTVIRVWGELSAGGMDWNATQIQVTRLEVAED
jgi:hypothetical protein